jgi:Trypsin
MATVETIAVQEAYVDPSWNSRDGSFDIMLLKLASASSAQWVPVNSNPAFPTFSSGIEIEALGIGRTARFSGLASDLQIKSMLAISRNACTALIKTGNSTGAFKTLNNNHMCFSDYGFNSGGQCLGDEGGPLVQVGSVLANDILVGVMSR